MEKKTIAFSSGTRKGNLDDNYRLYENGEILHEYDKNTYPGGYNLSKTYTVDEVSEDVKIRLLEAASEDNKDLVKSILKL